MICIGVAVILVSAVAYAEPAKGRRSKDSLKVGDKAPDFTLKVLGSKKKFILSSNFGKKPTVLIFGSYT